MPSNDRLGDSGDESGAANGRVDAAPAGLATALVATQGTLLLSARCRLWRPRYEATVHVEDRPRSGWRRVGRCAAGTAFPDHLDPSYRHIGQVRGVGDGRTVPLYCRAGSPRDRFASSCATRSERTPIYPLCWRTVASTVTDLTSCARRFSYRAKWSITSRDGALMGSSGGSSSGCIAM